MISIIALSTVILGISLYRGVLCRGSTVYLNCINPGVMELTRTKIVTITLDSYPLPLPLTLDPYPRPLPLTLDPYPYP